MEIKTITASYKVHLNLGDYNAAELSLSAHAELGPGDVPEEKANQLFLYCRKQIAARAVELIDEKKPKPTVTEFFQGMEVIK